MYAFRPKKALIIEPTFEEYEKVLWSVSCQVEHYILPEENNFNFCESVLNYLLKNHKEPLYLYISF